MVKVGDRVRHNVWPEHGPATVVYDDGDSDGMNFLIEFDKPIEGGHDGGNGEGKKGHCKWSNAEDLEQIEEEDMKRSNPKSFRNGDIIKVETSSVPGVTRDVKRVVFVKFGENYYNLSDGGQMKAYKYLPRGTKEVITNLSGLGEFFLMDPDELRSSFQEPDEEGDDDSGPLKRKSGPGSGSNSITPADWTRIIEDMEKWDKWSKSTDISATDEDQTITYIDATHGK